MGVGSNLVMEVETAMDGSSGLLRRGCLTGVVIWVEVGKIES